jgi:hypothetical protein
VDSNEDSKDKRNELDKLFSEMAVGGVAGAATGEPAGAALGVGAPIVIRGLTWAVGEFRQRVLGQREAYRVATVAKLARSKYEENINKGKELRDDDFFLKDEATGRTSADEIIEGTLLAAQREHEERKIPYYANLVANLPFERVIDRYGGNFLLRTAQDLSYRQLCLLALVAKKTEHVLPNTSERAPSTSWEAWFLKEELDDLGYAKRDLVLPERQGLDPSADTGVVTADLPTNIGVPADLKLAPGGAALYKLMGLAEIPDGELYKLSALLREWAGMNNVGD